VNKKTSLIFQILLLGIVLVVQSGCIKKTTRLSPDQVLLPAKTATRAELFENLRASSDRIKTLKGSVSLDLTKGGPKSGVLDEYRQTKGYVVVERPSHIRIQVQMPLVLTTVAVMVSDGVQYKVSIPVKNQFAVRDIDAPVDPKSTFSSLRPQIFLDGLFVDINPYLDNPNIKAPLFEESQVGVRSFYVFSFFDASAAEPQLVEKIWIDRQDLRVAKKQVFGKDGRLETDVDYQEYREEGGVAVPNVISIHRPIEDFSVRMTFTDRTINESLEAKVFELPLPEGANLVQVAK